MFKIDVIDEQGQKAGLKEIQRLLYAAGAQSLKSEIRQNVGVLTGTNRDVWAKNYKILESLSVQNKKNLATIASALFTVHLEDHSTISNPNYSHVQFLHNENGRDRWFDKTIQLIVASSGRAGINAEVSNVDASVHAKVAEYLTNSEPVQFTNQAEMFPEPEILEWIINEEIKEQIKSAHQTVTQLAKTTESVVMHYDILGERYIKEIARSDVNAFIQLALQVTWQRLHTQPANSSLTILTANGKFATNSIISEIVWDFAETFDNDDILYDEKRAKYHAAVTSIKQATSAISESSFSPIDQYQAHLQAFYRIANEEEKEKLTATFGTAPIAKNGLETANIQVSPGSSNNFFAGFSQSWAQGYGIAYAVGTDDIKVSVCCKKGFGVKGANAFKFVDELKRTFADIMILFPKSCCLLDLKFGVMIGKKSLL
ncbi:hypothetical protein HK100_008364 [Physocladia obscura]|uniref:Choline/carnitine acyltransferase domain-containing protein n=1 Tax=Physocladia obscura TaxID=109957 RepID=A0AAD5T569_9FUNG|nr:hypothetical protein HK100_008364 [Physocladia obscura]